MFYVCCNQTSIFSHSGINDNANRCMEWCGAFIELSPAGEHISLVVAVQPMLRMPFKFLNIYKVKVPLVPETCYSDMVHPPCLSKCACGHVEE
jgi:hypothetical protein